MLRETPQPVNCCQSKASQGEIGGDQGGMRQQVRLENGEHHGCPRHSGAKHAVPRFKKEEHEEQPHCGFGKSRPEQQCVGIIPINELPPCDGDGCLKIVLSDRRGFEVHEKQREGANQLCQRRVFGVDPVVGCLPIAIARHDMGGFVPGGGKVPAGGDDLRRIYAEERGHGHPRQQASLEGLHGGQGIKP